MAKQTQVEKKKLERGKAYFTLVGKAKINDYTFKMGVVSDKSGYKYNSINLGVETKPGNSVYAQAMGGYFPNKSENPIHVSDKDDMKVRSIIDWVDRFNPELLETVNRSNFVRIGLEKKDDGKIFVKQFLSWYDAIDYVKEHLTKDMVIKVAGVLNYQEYNGKVSVKKNIQSIFLSDAEPNDFAATFIQTCIFDPDTLGKPDKETREIPLDVRVIDYLKEFKYEVDGEQKVVPIKGNWPYNYTMFTKANLDPKTLEVLVKKFWKVKEITEIVVEGEFLEGTEMSEPTEADLSDEDKELIALNIYTLEEVLSRQTVRGDRVSKMVVIRPLYAMVKQEDGSEKGMLFITPKKYTAADLDTSFVYEEREEVEEDEEEIKVTKTEKTSKNGPKKPDEDSGDMDWLANL